jgi:ribosomal protein S18 acetylase RimI-like enzyme
MAQGSIALLMVHPEYHRQGVATALVKECESNCPANKLFTSTNESNTAMRLLLAKLGYARSGQIENLDEGDPELIFVKRLCLARGSNVQGADFSVAT